ncbi:hypothetical protein E4V42_00530 [Clostridium estertheticum]|uniref:DUF3006 domain-containing protein n=1 Tax=Clostridium estertheticum TaxID=238834 RepID=A0A5N7IVU6_9CLOT|nr:hypothetical protein [Clostridium estertheticum]MPQ29930.1 hypothetical protein [Clostridium estertheticum]MPQ60606.1 hypothetical protein [Clostridium estertheticum]
MFGKIIDMNSTDAFINFQDGTTIDVSITRLPRNSKIGDTIDLDNSNFINIFKNDMFNLF